MGQVDDNETTFRRRRTPGRFFRVGFVCGKGHIFQGRIPDLAAELPKLPPSGGSGSVFAAHLRRGAAVGEGHAGSGPFKEDASVVR